MTEKFDLIVIGGGRASTLAIGGACPNRGCVPSKLLIGFAEAARHVREAGLQFTGAVYNGTDTQTVFDSVNEWISGVDSRC